MKLEGYHYYKKAAATKICVIPKFVKQFKSAAAS